jgi:hypothetical protein
MLRMPNASAASAALLKYRVITIDPVMPDKSISP